MKKDISAYLKNLNHFLMSAQITARGLGSFELEAGLDEGIQAILSAVGRGGKIIFVGNGGSAAIASHQAIDFSKNGGMPAIAFNDASLLTCLSNDYGYAHVFEKPIEWYANPNDLVVAISSSGKSENIIRAARAARAKGCFVMTFSGFAHDNPLRAEGDLNFYVPALPGQYGFVEIAHLTLSHCMLEVIIDRKAAQKDKLAETYESTVLLSQRSV
jgi:D-sedoheptulose 7-phosphate isomerase